MKTSLVIFFMLISNLILFAQNDLTPLDLTKKYFNRELSDYNAVLIDEAIEQHFNPNAISKYTIFKFEILTYAEDKAVIAVSINDYNFSQDLYVFLIKNKEWKIKAFRSFWLPNMFYSIVDKYKNLDANGMEKEYDNMIKQAKIKNDSLSIEQIIESIGTIDDFRYLINNLKLTIASDSILIEHFLKNKEKFTSLLTKIKKDTVTCAGMWQLDVRSSYKIEIQDILLSSISNFYDDNLINFVIGGMIDNSVGYFYCENVNNLPEITDSRYIMIRKLGNGWYLYKTT